MARGVEGLIYVFKSELLVCVYSVKRVSSDPSFCGGLGNVTPVPATTRELIDG